MGEQKDKAERAERMKKLRWTRAKEMSYVLIVLMVARAFTDFLKWLGEPVYIAGGILTALALIWYIWFGVEE